MSDDATDHDHDPAADLPWGDDTMPPFPLVTDPDPGAPMPTCVCPDGCRSYCVDRCAGDEPPTPKAATPVPLGIPVYTLGFDPSEELAGLREFRADYDRLMSTEGQSHGEAIAALSGLVASARQGAARDITPEPMIASILHRWGPGRLWEIATEDGDVDGYVRAVDHETAMRAAAELGCEGDYTASECAEEPASARVDHAVADITALLTEHARLTAALTACEARCDALADRVTAAEGRLELERATPGPHIPPALMRRVEALGFVPGSGEPVGWLVGYAVGLAALLTTAQGERDELAATLANERGEGAPPSEGWKARRRGGEARWVLHNERPGRVLDVVRRMGDAPRTIVSHWWDREVNQEGEVVVTHAEGEAETMRAAMRAAQIHAAALVIEPSPSVRR